MPRPRIPSLLLLALSPFVLATASELRLPGGGEVRLPHDLELSNELQSIAFGERDAFAFAIDREHRGRVGSTVEIQDASGERHSVEFDLRIRDLHWLPDGRLLAVAFRAARRTQGEAFLLEWEPARVRFKRVMRLPPTARDLTRGSRAGLLLTARDELRTITLPSLQSGPLYRVLGENRAATAVDGDRVLVGQSEALLLVDLSDRQSREQLPVREQVAVDSPVEQLSATFDGRAVLAGLLDGSVFSVQFDPLRLDAAGAGWVVAAFAPPPVEEITGATREPDDPLPTIERTLPDPVQPAPQFADSAVAPDGESLATVARSTDPVATPDVAKPPVEPPPADPPQADGTDGSSAVVRERSSIQGRLSGPATSAVRAVVAFGPNSLLREASRVTPTEDGAFRFGPLPEGRYRIQLDGGGGRLIVSEPAFQIVDVTDGSNASLEFRILQAL